MPLTTDPVAVIKRNGATASFTLDKITHAICLRRPPGEFDEHRASLLAQAVLARLQRRVPTVEQVQDQVERT